MLAPNRDLTATKHFLQLALWRTSGSQATSDWLARVARCRHYLTNTDIANRHRCFREIAVI
jgi:hypothetical protein